MHAQLFAQPDVPPEDGRHYAPARWPAARRLAQRYAVHNHLILDHLEPLERQAHCRGLIPHVSDGVYGHRDLTLPQNPFGAWNPPATSASRLARSIGVASSR
jgi:hypothetical protein